MNTEKGKMSYVNNLKQIRNATLDTIYLGVIRAYLSCKSVGQALVEMYGTNPSQVSSSKGYPSDCMRSNVLNRVLTS